MRVTGQQDPKPAN